MKKVKLSSKNLISVRKSRGFTQEQVATAMEVSKRTYQRLEDLKKDTFLSHSEIGKISKALRFYPHYFWDELPFYYYVYGVEIKSVNEFVDSFHAELEIKHIPDDTEIENGILELIEFHKANKSFKFQNISDEEMVKKSINLRNLYRILTTENKVDRLKFYLLPTARVGIPELWDDNDEMTLGECSWSHKLILRAVAANDDAPVQKVWTSINGVFDGVQYQLSDFHNYVKNEDFIQQALEAVKIPGPIDNSLESLPDFYDFETDIITSSDENNFLDNKHEEAE